jgi:hypothetical protein
MASTAGSKKWRVTKYPVMPMTVISTHAREIAGAEVGERDQTDGYGKTQRGDEPCLCRRQPRHR